MLKTLFNLAAIVGLSVAQPAVAQIAGQADSTDSFEKVRQSILEDPVAPRIQPKEFDVTIIEYMDYQCPYCRASVVPMKQLLATDKKVRVIFRDWPVFGPASERAARLAIVSQWQGKHSAFHDALMLTPRPLSEAKIRTAAKKAGVDWMRLMSDLKTHSSEVEALLQRNANQAEEIGLEGTPGFIIGNVQSFGAMNLEQFRAAVKDARKHQPGAPLTQQAPGL